MKTKIAIVLVLAVSLWMAGCSDGMDVAEFPDLEGGLTEMDDNSNEDAGIVDGEADEDAQADAAAESDSDESKETDSGVEEELEGPVGKGVGDFNITNPPKLIRDDDDASVAMEAKKYPAPIIVNPHPASFKVVGGVDIEVPQKRAHKVRVTYWTGDRKKGGTDEFVGIKFCKEEGLLSESSMDTPGICKLFMSEARGFEKGDVDEYTFELGNAAQFTLDQLPFFRVGIISNPKAKYGDGDKAWFLQGLKVELIYDDGSTSVSYWNPCVNEWLNSTRGWERDFGPEDTAMCAIIRTCDRKKAGTDDKVSIAFKNVEDAVLISAAYPSYDDNERGKETAYGKTFQGYDPFESFADREFRVEKGKDGEYGGWCLENVDFYFFSPGKSFVADSEAPESFYEASYAPDGDDMWLKDDDLTTEWIAIYGMEDLPYDWETLGSIR